MSSIDAIIDKLASTSVDEEKEVSFAGRSLKLDTEKDAEEVVEAIKNCVGMTTLKLEGNTIGVDAAKAIAKALETQPKFKKALWKDMFTRRTEHEIPDALNHLSSGITLAKAHLVILDLSDNAFGPRGLKGIVNLLKSEPCFTLKELYLNNNGLGISGGNMLATALTQCLENSRNEGKSLSLKIFVCGRNRLENEGALALSKILKDIGTLELIAMPQNGIYHEGIKALSEAIAANANLKCLNLEDNSLTKNGAKAIAKQLPALKNLEILNLGDCLVRTEGAMAIAEALKNSCPFIKEIYLGYNEINAEGGKAVVKAVENKSNLVKLVLNGNQFGSIGCEKIEEMMTAIGKESILNSLSEDESEGDDDDENEGNDNEGEEEENINTSRVVFKGGEVYIKSSESGSNEEDDDSPTLTVHTSPMHQKVSLQEFLEDPSPEKLLSLQISNILPEIKNNTKTEYINVFLKISSVVKPNDEKTKDVACKYADSLLSAVFEDCKNSESSVINNYFLSRLGLIKNEDKIKPIDDLTGALIVLEHAIQQKYFLSSTKDLLQFFLSRPKSLVVCAKTKHCFMQTLFQVM